MIKLKDGVRVVGMRPEIALAIAIAGSVYDLHKVDCVVTSIVDGKHSETSLHYSGAAFDLRTRDLAHRAEAEQIAIELRAALGVDYDVVVEVDHIHVEFQPPRLDA